MPVSASPSLLEGNFEEAAIAAQDDAAEWARLLILAMAAGVRNESRKQMLRLPDCARASPIRQPTKSPRSTRIAGTRIGLSSGSSARDGSATVDWSACGEIPSS